MIQNIFSDFNALTLRSAFSLSFASKRTRAIVLLNHIWRLWHNYRKILVENSACSTAIDSPMHFDCRRVADETLLDQQVEWANEIVLKYLVYISHFKTGVEDCEASKSVGAWRVEATERKRANTTLSPMHLPPLLHSSSIVSDALIRVRVAMEDQRSRQ